MRILVVSMHYAPEAAGNAPYVTDLAEHLARMGNDVHVLTGMPCYPRWRVHREYRHVMWRRERVNGVTLYRRRQYVPRSPSALHRALSEATARATGSIVATAVATAVAPDVVVGVVPTLSDGLVAASIARRRGTPYGLVFQDLVSVGASQSGVASHRVTPLLTRLERHMVSGVAAVGIVADGFRPHIEALGVPADRIFRLRNWNRLNPSTRDPRVTRRVLQLPEDAVICLHAGNMGAKQALENVIECARLAQARSPRLLFVLMGDGNQRAALARLVERYRLRNMRLMDPQPNDAYSNVLRAADILILNQRHTLTDMALPSKLTAYFAAGRPIVAAVRSESEAALEVRAARAGVTCAPQDPRGMLRALEDLVDDPSLRGQLGASGARYCGTHLESASVLSRWAKFVESLAGGPDRLPVSSASPSSTDQELELPHGTA
jgi:colanic acid biosynthesis glycosyl transferase WcaI